MRQRSLPVLLLSLVALVGFLSIYLGIAEGYFLKFWWWDTIVHLIAGAASGVGACWAAYALRKKPTLLMCLAGAFFLGIGWEIFEYYIGAFDHAFMGYTADTLKDVANDGVGGLAVGLFLIKRIRS